MNTFILSRQKADFVSNAILKQTRQCYLLFFVNRTYAKPPLKRGVGGIDSCLESLIFRPRCVSPG